MNSKFPKTFKYIRKHTKYKGKVGMTIQDLTDLIGVSNPYISQLEKENSGKHPSLKVIEKLATGLTTESEISKEIMNDFLLNLTSGNNADLHQALKISNSLGNNHYSDFLTLIIGEDTTKIETLNDLSDMSAVDVIKQIKNYEQIHNQQLVNEYEKEKPTMFLNKILDDDNLEIIFDNKQLDKSEIEWLKASLILLRTVRNKEN